jgi:uncharacterized protein
MFLNESFYRGSKKALLDEIIAQFRLPLDSMHGPAHWARVRYNGLLLAKSTGADTLVVELFAFLHDSQRENDGGDPEHGPRAAEFARQHCGELFHLNSRQLGMLMTACAGHTKDRHSSCITAQTCWDADRLDLGRPGVEFEIDPYYLGTSAARNPAVIRAAVARSCGKRYRDHDKDNCEGEGMDQQSRQEHIARLRSCGAQVKGDKVILYRGAEVDASVIQNLRYGDYLSSVKGATDAMGNGGAASYGKNVVRFELPIETVHVTGAGEFQFKGASDSLEGGRLYPEAVYRAYNDYYASNYTAKEINAQDNVRAVASMSLSGGREEFDDLISAMQENEDAETEADPDRLCG